jgi:RHO1 GDP-GTP exchange protein 1/2
MHTTAEGRIVPERAYRGANQASSPPHDRSYSLTSAQQRRPEDRSYTMSSDPRGTYAATRAGPSASQQQQRRPEEGRSNTMSGRVGGNSSPAGSGSPQLDFTRPVAQPRQTTLPPGSPRRAAPPPASASSRSGAVALMGVREEGVADPYRTGTASSSAASTPAQHSSLPPIVTTTPGNRHESVDSTYSDQDSIPQRTKSSSSFPSAGPPSSTTDRRPSLPKAPSSQPSLSRTRAPIVYPALLSRVALALRERLIMGDKQKDGLTYPNAFTGSEAVDIISYVIKTSDRNLALLLGRALDAQRWFHDVTYMHRYQTPTYSI